jgi:hypothetical protein
VTNNDESAPELALITNLLQQLLALQLGGTPSREDDAERPAESASDPHGDNDPNNSVAAHAPVPSQPLVTITTTITTPISSFEGHSMSQTVSMSAGGNGDATSLPTTPVKTRTAPLSSNATIRASPHPTPTREQPSTPTSQRWYSVTRARRVGVMQGWWYAVNSLLKMTAAY